jgi:hypothetical protein
MKNEGQRVYTLDIDIGGTQKVHFCMNKGFDVCSILHFWFGLRD